MKLERRVVKLALLASFVFGASVAVGQTQQIEPPAKLRIYHPNQIAITKFEVVPQVITSDQSVNLIVHVKNLTTESLPRIKIRIMGMKPTGGAEIVYTRSWVFGPHEVENFEQQNWRGSQHGTWRFTAEVDWDHVLGEDVVNSADNQKTETLSLYDDRVQVVDAQFSPPTSILLRIKNVTDGPLDIPYEIRDGDTVIHQGVKNQANPGESEVPVPRVTAVQTPGLHRITFIADPQNRIPETDLARTNNRKTIQYRR